MKEQYIPVKDIKTGAKVFGIVTKEVFKSVEPELTYYTGKKFRKLAESFRKNRI